MPNRPIYRQISKLSTTGLSRPINTLSHHMFQFSIKHRLPWIKPVVLLRHLLIRHNRPIYRQISKLSTTGLSRPINTISPHMFQFSIKHRLPWIKPVMLLRHLLNRLNRPIYLQISKLSTTGLTRPIKPLSPHRFQFSIKHRLPWKNPWCYWGTS